MKKYLYLALILLIGFMPLNVFAKDGSPAMTRLNEALASEGITPNNDSYTGSGNKVRIYIFRGQGCGYCKRLLTYLNSIIDEYKDTVNIKTYEVWYDADNSALMDNAAATMGDTVGGVPYMIIGDKSFKGYSESSNNSIISQIKKVAAEENPYDGVQMGIAPDGEPNLVEEGEVIFNDYVFSNRLNVPQAIRNKYRLRGKKDLTFAEAAKKLQKEAEEMPNDAIAKRGLIASMTRLQNAQEALKGVNEFNDLSQQYSLGGSMFFDEGGKIRIAPSKKGTFTAAAKKHSMGVQEFASKVLANKDNYSPAMVKKANFARNAAKWHANGGHLYLLPNETNDYTNQLYFGNYPGLFGMYNNPERQAYIEDAVNYAAAQAELDKDLNSEKDRIPYQIREEASPIRNTGKTASPKKEQREERTNTWVNNTIPPLFYAPAIGSGVQAFTDLMGWTNRPDYSSSRSLMSAAANIPTVRSTPIGDYVAYTPFDRLFYANQLGNQAAGTRRNILNTSGGNRGMAMAGILAADAAAQTKLGELFRQADEFNLTNRFKGAEFNRGTNQYNSQNSLAAQQANIDVSKLKLNALQNALNMRDTERRLTDSNRSTNLTNFLTNLGTVGLQQFNNRQFNILGKNGYFDRRIRS